MQKRKILYCKYHDVRVNSNTVNFSCTDHRFGVSKNSSHYIKCRNLMHHKYTEDTLKEDPNHVSKHSTNQLPHSLLHNNTHIFQMFSLNKYSSFVLVFRFGVSGGCIDAVNAKLRSSWKKYKKFLSILNEHWKISCERCGYMCNSCIYSVMFMLARLDPWQ